MGKIAKIIVGGLFACQVALLSGLIYVKFQSYQEILNLKAALYKESGILIGRNEEREFIKKTRVKPLINLSKTYGKELDTYAKNNYELVKKNCRLENENSLLKDRIERIKKGGLEREMVLGLLETEASQGK